MVSSPEAGSQQISQSGWKLKEVGRGERWGEGRSWDACQAFCASFQWSWAGSVGEPRGAAWGYRRNEDCVCCPSPKFLSAFYLISACVRVCSLSGVQPFVPLWTVTHQAPLSMEFPRQEYLSGLPFPSPADLPYPRTEPSSSAVPALAVGKPILYPVLIKNKIDN